MPDLAHRVRQVVHSSVLEDTFTRYRTDLWTTWVWTARVHLYVCFSFFNSKYLSITRSMVGWICGYGGSTISYTWNGGSAPLNPHSSSVNCSLLWSDQVLHWVLLCGQTRRTTPSKRWPRSLLPHLFLIFASLLHPSWNSLSAILFH